MSLMLVACGNDDANAAKTVEEETRVEETVEKPVTEETVTEEPATEESNTDFAVSGWWHGAFVEAENKEKLL